MIYCCEDMARCIHEGDVSIVYYPDTRVYGIKILDGGSAFQQIYHCPWCGDKLPRELNRDWVIEVCKSLNITEDEIYDLDDASLPLEFKTDEWWKKRGL